MQSPFENLLSQNVKSVVLTYPVNMKFEAGSSYALEKTYWGTCKLSGQFTPEMQQLAEGCLPGISEDVDGMPFIKESRLSNILLDVNESEAMLEMVRKLALPPRKDITVSYAGWKGGLSYLDFEEPGSKKRMKEDKKTLVMVKRMLGSCYVSFASTWYGAYRSVSRLGPQDESLSPPSGRKDFIRWMNSKGLKPLHFCSLKRVHGWLKGGDADRFNPYCREFDQWKGNPKENCPANPAFVKWLSSILISDLKNGFRGFMSDEPGPTVPRYSFACPYGNHLHLPGNVSYAYFFRYRRLFDKLRDTLGPEFQLQAQRPQMDLGIWSALNVNTLFTFVESEGKSADMIRLWARMRRSISFVPSYLDQIMVQPGLEPTDHVMLSALAVSSNYIFTAPVRPDGLEEFSRGVKQRDHRPLMEGIRKFPRKEKKRVRFWLDWARKNREYM